MSWLESWCRSGPECQQAEAQWQKFNVHLTRLDWRMITQNRAAEKIS